MLKIDLYNMVDWEFILKNVRKWLGIEMSMGWVGTGKPSPSPSPPFILISIRAKLSIYFKDRILRKKFSLYI